MKIKKVEKLYIYINSNAKKFNPPENKRKSHDLKTPILPKQRKTIKALKTKVKYIKQEINYKIRISKTRILPKQRNKLKL